MNTVSGSNAQVEGPSDLLKVMHEVLGARSTGFLLGTSDWGSHLFAELRSVEDGWHAILAFRQGEALRAVHERIESTVDLRESSLAEGRR